MPKLPALLAVLGLTLSCIQGCANNPAAPTEQKPFPDLSNDCSAQFHYENKSCIPAPPPPNILDNE